MPIEFHRDGPWDLPEAWVWARLGDLGRWVGGGTPSKSNAAFWTNGTIPWISPKDMKQDIVGDSPDRITADAVANSTTKLVPPNSVLMVVRSGILNHTFPVAVSDREVTINQDVRALAPFEGVDARYMAFVLKRLQRPILHECSKDGTTVASVEPNRLEGIFVPIAPAAEQRRIVARIDELFTEIADGETALAKAQDDVDTWRRALLKSAVTGELTREWRAQNHNIESGQQLLCKLKPQHELFAKGHPTSADWTFLRNLPQGWGLATLQELAMDLPNAFAIGPFGSNLVVSDYQPSGVPLVFVRHIRANDFVGLSPKFVSKAKAKELSSHLVRGGDILVTKMGEPPGDVAIYPIERPDAIITADCIKLTPNRKIPARWIKIALTSEIGRAQVRQITKGVAQQKVNLANFRKVVIPVPSELEMAEIIRLIDAHQIEMPELEERRTILIALRQSVLKSAFDGSLVEQDPADEPADSLLRGLERVAASGASRRAPGMPLAAE